MGFWSTLGKIASSASDYMDKVDRESNDYAEKYSDMSDEELLDKYKHGWGGVSQKIGVTKVLKERGYGSRDDDD